jgi:hypothetical protein
MKGGWKMGTGGLASNTRELPQGLLGLWRAIVAGAVCELGGLGFTDSGLPIRVLAAISNNMD